MSGTQYIALSGLRARMDELDRLAADISNVGTSGYKGLRETRAAAERPSFDETLNTAIDTTFGGAKNDMSSGSIASTGRPLDVAIDGDGFFTLDTANGPAYTRNGHFSINNQRQLVDSDGDPVLGTSGSPITLGDGDARVDEDGTVWAGNTQAGQLGIVTFPDPGALSNRGGQVPGERADAHAGDESGGTRRRARGLERLGVGTARGIDDGRPRV